MPRHAASLFHLRHKSLGKRHSLIGIGAVSVGSNILGKLVGDGRTAYHDLHLIPYASLLERLQDISHVCHRSGKQGREAEDIGLVVDDGIDECLSIDINTYIDDLESGSLKHRGDEVLAYVMKVALHCAYDDASHALDCIATCFHDRFQDSERGLHRPSCHEQLGDESLPFLKTLADDSHRLYHLGIDEIGRDSAVVQLAACGSQCGVLVSGYDGITQGDNSLLFSLVLMRRLAYGIATAGSDSVPAILLLRRRLLATVGCIVGRAGDMWFRRRLLATVGCIIGRARDMWCRITAADRLYETL